MGINTKNYLTRLGIESSDIKTTLENLTDEEVKEAYLDRLVDLYMNLQKDHKQKIGKGEWEEIEDELKANLYHQIKSMTLKAQILILENKIDEYEKTKTEKASIEIYKEMYKVAYDALSTEEGRKQYLGTLRRKKQFNQDLQNLIIKDGGDSRQILETKIFGKGNVPRDIKENETVVPEYNVEYKDESITLCRLKTITFNNGQFQDNFKKYVMFARNEQSHISIGYDFYGEIEIDKMENPEYRVALYQAIGQSMMEEKNYIGYIGKDNNGFYRIKDEAQEIAVLEYEKKQKEKLIEDSRKGSNR